MEVGSITSEEGCKRENEIENGNERWKWSKGNMSAREYGNYSVRGKRKRNVNLSKNSSFSEKRSENENVNDYWRRVEERYASRL